MLGDIARRVVRENKLAALAPRDHDRHARSSRRWSSAKATGCARSSTTSSPTRSSTRRAPAASRSAPGRKAARRTCRWSTTGPAWGSRSASGSSTRSSRARRRRAAASRAPGWGSPSRASTRSRTAAASSCRIATDGKRGACFRLSLPQGAPLDARQHRRTARRRIAAPAQGRVVKGARRFALLAFALLAVPGAGRSPRPSRSPPFRRPSPRPRRRRRLPIVRPAGAEPGGARVLGRARRPCSATPACRPTTSGASSPRRTRRSGRTRSDASRIRVAVLQTLTRQGAQDDQRALQLLDAVAKSNAGYVGFRQLAAALSTQVAERVRAVREEQARSEAAIQKLEALARDGAQPAARPPAGRRRRRRRLGRELTASVHEVTAGAMHTSDILLVDDDPDLLRLISLRLTSAGYRVRTADSGETALAALAVARPAAVVTDLRMPGHGRHAALRGDPPRASDAAGHHPDRARHDPRRRRGDAARRSSASSPSPSTARSCCRRSRRRSSCPATTAR